jgi:hypothetical protein
MRQRTAVTLRQMVLLRMQNIGTLFSNEKPTDIVFIAQRLLLAHFLAFSGDKKNHVRYTHTPTK